MTETYDTTDVWARPSDDAPGDNHLLVRHSKVVRDRMGALLGDAPLRTLDDDRELARVVGYTHDAGKATEWFQRMIRGEEELRGDPRTYHSLLGALFCMFALSRRGFGSVEQALAGLVVQAHHSSMPDPGDRVSRALQVPRDPSADPTAASEAYERADRQLASIAATASSTGRHMVEEATGGAATFKEFVEYVEDREFLRTFNRSRLSKPDGTDDELYGDILLLYSALKLADTSHSAGVVDEDLLDGRLLDRDALECHLDAFSDRTGVQGRIDDLRTRAQDRALDRAELLLDDDGPNVGSIWLPTGFGKTLAGLRAALAIAEGAGKDRVVYALPFTSIIDQTAEVIADVFDVEPGSPEFIVHHYLAERAKAVERGDEVDSSIEYLLGGSWRAGCVLTTFVQVFESVIAPRGSWAPKVPAIRNSVIVLDEPQELPPRLWPLLARTIELLVDRFDAHVLFMTATRPRFFEAHSDCEVVELIDDESPYVELLRDHPRVRYRLDESTYRYVSAPDGEAEDVLPLTHSDGARAICAALTGKARSALAVCNTVSSSRELYRSARLRLNEDGRRPVSPALAYHALLARDGAVPSADELVETIRTVADRFEDPVVTCNLTARHRPPDRRVLIDATTDLLKDEALGVLMTSTRLIEAGVDMSVDRVYRDIAQVPSIVQAAGRCNREFGSDGEGVVTVWRLGDVEVDEESGKRVKHGRTPASYIYGSAESGAGGMAQTRAALRDRGRSIDEADMITDVIEEFFSAMHEYGHGEEDLAAAVDTADVDALRRVQLIEEQPWLADTIVTRTDDERDAVEALADAFADGDRGRQKRLLDDLGSIRYPTPIPTDEDGNLTSTSGFEPLTDRGDAGLLWLDEGMFEFNPDMGVL